LPRNDHMAGHQSRVKPTLSSCMTSDFGARVVVRKGVTEASERVFGSKFMFLSMDTCRDPDRESFLTTADTPPLSHLSEHADGKWGSGVNWEKSFCLHLWSFIQITIRNIYVHLLWIFRIYEESPRL